MPFKALQALTLLISVTTSVMKEMDARETGCVDVWMEGWIKGYIMNGRMGGWAWVNGWMGR